ncbi:Membrane-bound lysozyme-inhibitor of c-type lysozyme [compost metagenome]
MTRSAVALLSCLGLTVAACSQEAPTAPTSPVEAPATQPAAAVGYACESGKVVTATYPDTETAQVSYDGRDYVLTSAVSASGARYAGQGLEWWTASRNGLESATLSRLGPNDQVGGAAIERCSRPVAALAPAPVGPCTGSDLKLSVEGGDAGMGNRVTVLALQNTGARTCSLTGYPTVTLADASGGALGAVKAVQEPGNYFAQGTTPTAVSLKPQSKAYFDLAWNVVPHEAEGEKTCPEAKTLRATTPGDTALVSLPLALTPCGRQIRVSPFRPVIDASASPAPPA